MSGERRPTIGMRNYAMDLDGPLLRRQRELLLRIHGQSCGDDRDLMDGIIELLDNIADQGASRGLDCLLSDEDES